VRLADAKQWRISVPMTEPFRISSGEVATKDAILLRVSDGEAFGWGESSAMAGAFYSADTPDSCERELSEKVVPGMLGEYPDMLALEARLAELTESRFVRVAVETAAWEMIARRRGVSLRALFEIPDRPVPSGLAIGLYDTLDGLRAAIDRYEPRQYHRLKIKIKRGHDIELVSAVRKWLGDFPLFVDANADYSIADLDVFRELDRYNLMMFEQPLAKDAVFDSAALQRAVRTPVCFDEGIESVADARRAHETGACRIVNIKLQRVGGFLEAFRIVEFCESVGIPLWMGTMPELGIGSAQALVLAAHPAFVYPTDVEPSARWYRHDIVSPELVLRDRSLVLPAGPGLGFTVNVAAL
jgi:O-succinylbenzoate synthase